jgi:hypothetical protein
MEKENINKFLSGKLTDAEHEKFKSEIANNEQLLKEVGNEVINEYGRIKLMSKLQGIDKGITGSKLRFKTYLVAAVMFLALGIPLLMNMMNGSITGEKLFASHYAPYKTVLTIRGNEIGDKLLSNGMLAYSNGNYQEAIINFESITDKSYVVNFYLGVSYLGVKPPKGKESINNLNEVLATDNDFHQQATWYKAMALLVTKKRADAKKLFEKIKDNKWFNYEKAIEVLEGM